MGRPRKNPVQDNVTPEKVVTPTVKEKVEEKVVEPKTKVKVDIADDEDVEIISLNPNVSYHDKATDETYHWGEVGEINTLPFSVVKNMWRNHKNYFRYFYLKPLDERVIDKLGLTKTYEKYNFLTDSSSYTKDNVNKIINTLNENTIAFKSAICNSIKSMIIEGKISDLYVVRTLGRYFDVDFIALLD
jgi:hypothetical protein